MWKPAARRATSGAVLRDRVTKRGPGSGFSGLGASKGQQTSGEDVRDEGKAACRCTGRPDGRTEEVLEGERKAKSGRHHHLGNQLAGGRAEDTKVHTARCQGRRWSREATRATTLGRHVPTDPSRKGRRWRPRPAEGQQNAMEGPTAPLARRNPRSTSVRRAWSLAVIGRETPRCLEQDRHGATTWSTSVLRGRPERDRGGEGQRTAVGTAARLDRDAGRKRDQPRLVDRPDGDCKKDDPATSVAGSAGRRLLEGRPGYLGRQADRTADTARASGPPANHRRPLTVTVVRTSRSPR